MSTALTPMPWRSSRAAWISIVSCSGPRPIAVGAAHDRGDALGQVRQARGQFGQIQPALGVGVHVHKPGGDVEAVGLDGAAGDPAGQVADACDPAVGDRQVGDKRLRAAAVDDSAAPD